MEDSDGESEAPPPGWTKSKSEWEWEQARRRRLERVAQKIKKPGSAKKERAAARAASALGDDDAEAAVPSPAADAPDVEELLQTRSSLQALCDLKDARIAKEASTAALLRQELAQLQQELEKTKDEKHDLETQHAAKEAPLNVKIREQKREIERLEVELAASRAAEQELDKRASELEGGLAKAKAEAADAKRKLFVQAEVAKDKEAAQQQAESLQQEVDGLRAAVAASEATLQEVSRKERDQWAESNAELKEQLAKQKAELDAATEAALGEMRLAAAREGGMETARKSADDLGRVNSKIADIEEEMAASMKALERTMLALGSKVKRGNGDILRLNMTAKLQQGQLDSFKRQLADAEERLGKGSSKSRRDVEVLEDKLKTAVDVRKTATMLSESMMEDLSLLRENYKAVLQEQRVVCASLDGHMQASSETARDLQRAQTSTAEKDAMVQGLSAEVSHGLKQLKTETESILKELAHASVALSDSCKGSEEKVLAMGQRVDALGLKVAGERELVDALNQRLADAKRESLAWEKCAEQRQTQCEKMLEEMEELKKGVTAHVRNMQHQLPGVLDIVGEIIENEEEVDEVKSAAVFVEIVRVRDQNSELKERIRKYEAKLSEYQGAKRIIESLESKVIATAAARSSEQNDTLMLLRTLKPFIDEVAALLKSDMQELHTITLLRGQVLDRQASLNAFSEGLKVLSQELLAIFGVMKKDFAKMGMHVRSQHQNALLMKADIADKQNDIERLDEMLSRCEQEKMAAVAMHEEIKMLLDKERHDRVNCKRELTHQLALAQSSSEKQAWIFQSRLEKEEMAVQMAEKEDEIAGLQRKLREATSLEKHASKKSAELAKQVNNLMSRERSLEASLEEILTRESELRRDLETEHAELMAEKATSKELEARLSEALAALKNEEEVKNLISSRIASDTEAASTKLDCLSADREALIDMKIALEHTLDKQDRDFARLHASHKDEQAEWDVERSRYKREISLLKAQRQEWEEGAALMLKGQQGDTDEVLRRHGRLLAYVEISERKGDYNWNVLLLKTAFMALSSHARRRSRMWNLASSFVRSRDIRESEYIVGKWWDLWKNGHRRHRQSHVSIISGDDANGMVLHLQPPQLKQMTHQELCTHVQKLQLSCTNLQHKLTNVNSRANHTEAELKVALQQIRRLKKDLSELRKVGTQIKSINEEAGRQSAEIPEAMLRHGNASARERAGLSWSPGQEGSRQQGDERHGPELPNSQFGAQDALRRENGGGKGGDDRHSLMHLSHGIASSTPSRVHLSYEAKHHSYNLAMNPQHVHAAPAAFNTLAFK